MKEDIKNKWVAALRSGKYLQTKGALKDPYTNSYCCLGVLCDISNLSKFINNSNGTVSYSNTYGVLPYAVQTYAGIQNGGGNYKNTSLVHQNDDENKTFEEIADIIEKHWKDL